MEIPFEIGQKVYVKYYDQVREITIKKITVDEDRKVRLISDYDTFYPEDIFLDIHEAFKSLRDQICNQFKFRLEAVDKQEEQYLSNSTNNEQE